MAMINDLSVEWRFKLLVEPKGATELQNCTVFLLEAVSALEALYLEAMTEILALKNGVQLPPADASDPAPNSND